jgi:hypothetical protein
MPPQRVENTCSSLVVVFYWIHVINCCALTMGIDPNWLVTQHIKHVTVLHKTCAKKEYSLERGVKIHVHERGFYVQEYFSSTREGDAFLFRCETCSNVEMFRCLWSKLAELL